MGFFDLGLGLVMSLPSLKDQGSGRTLDFKEILEFFLGSFGFQCWNWKWVVVAMKVELRESIC